MLSDYNKGHTHKLKLEDDTPTATSRTKLHHQLAEESIRLKIYASALLLMEADVVISVWADSSRPQTSSFITAQ